MIKRFSVYFFIFAIFFIPVSLVHAQSSVPKFNTWLVQCGYAPYRMCTYCDIVPLFQRILSLLVVLGVISAVLLFVYAGFLYITATGNESKISSAHKIFFNVLIGLIFVLTAWLIVNTIMMVFLRSDFGDWNALPGCPSSSTLPLQTSNPNPSSLPTLPTPPASNINTTPNTNINTTPNQNSNPSSLPTLPTPPTPVLL